MRLHGQITSKPVIAAVLLILCAASCLAQSADLQSAERALELARQGRFDEAFRIYRMLEQSGDLTWRDRGDWGIALNWAERYGDASRQLQRAIADGPEVAPPYLVRALAIALVGSGEIDKGWRITETYVLPERGDPATDEDLATIAYLLNEQGLALVEDQRYGRGLDLLERATQLSDDRQLRVDLGRAYGWAGQHERAVAVLEDVETSGPEDAYVLVALGDALAALGRSEEAAEAYARASRLGDDASGERGLETIADELAQDAAERIRAGDLDGAIALLRQAVETAPDVPRLRAELAAALRAAGRHEEAKSEYERTLTAYGDDAPEYVRSGYAEMLSAEGIELAEQGHVGPGLRLLEQAVALAPQSAKIRADHGIGLNWAGRHAEAAQQLGQAADQYGADAPLYVRFALIDALHNAGRTDDAVEVARRAMARYPDARSRVESVLAGIGREVAADALEAAKADDGDRADALIDRALDIAPMAWQVNADVGIALNWMGRYADAEPYLQRALDRAPEPAPAWVADALVTSLIGQGVHDVALDTAEEWLQEYPDDAALIASRRAAVRAMTDEAMELWRQDERRTALARMEAIAERVPDLPDVAVDLGVMLHWAGQNERAAVVLEEALAGTPEPPDYASLAYAGALLRVGELERAAAVYGDLYRSDPESAAVRDGLEAVAERLAADAMEAAYDEMHTEAIRQLRTAVDLAPWAWRPRGDLGIVMLWNEDVAEAVGQLERSVELAGADAPAYLLRALGDAYMATERYAEAEEAYRRAIEASPEDETAEGGLEGIPRGMGEIALRLAWQGDYEAAYGALEQTLADHPQGDALDLEPGALKAMDRRAARAAERLAQWLAEAEDPPFMAFVALSDAYLEAGQPDRSLEVWGSLPADVAEPQVVERFRARAAEQIARAAYELGATEGQEVQADELFQGAMALDPENWRITGDYGLLLVARGDYRRAEAVLSQATDMADAPPVYLLRTFADALSYGGDPEAALPYYQDALRREPDDWGSIRGLGRALAWLRRGDEALGLIREVLADDPSNVDAIATEAYILAVSNDLREALKRYDDAIALAPERLDLKVAKAQALNWIGWHEEAYELLTGEVLAEAPRSKDARIQLVEAALYSGRPELAVDTWDGLRPHLYDSVFVDDTDWELRPYMDPSIQVGLNPSLDTASVLTGLGDAILEWPVEPDFRVSAAAGSRPLREPGVTDTQWTHLRLGVDWQIDHQLRYRGGVRQNYLRNTAAYAVTTFDNRVDYRANDRLSLFAHYRRDLLETPRAMLQRLYGDDISLGGAYRWDHKDRVDAAVSRMAVSDGNLRTWTSASWVRRVDVDDDRYEDFVLEFRRLTNTQPSPFYWSPAEYDSLMAKYVWGREGRSRKWSWRIVTGLGLAYESGVGFYPPAALELHASKRIGSDDEFAGGIGFSTSNAGRLTPGAGSYGIGYLYLSYRHFF